MQNDCQTQHSGPEPRFEFDQRSFSERLAHRVSRQATEGDTCVHYAPDRLEAVELESNVDLARVLEPLAIDRLASAGAAFPQSPRLLAQFPYPDKTLPSDRMTRRSNDPSSGLRASGEQ